MKHGEQRLPGIAGLWVVDAEHLPSDVALMGMSGVPVPVMCRMERVQPASMPSASRKSVRSAEGTYDEAQLEFETAHAVDMPQNPAFVVRTLDGDCFLLGGREQPRLTVEATETTGAPAGERAAVAYTVKHVARAALVRCTIYKHLS